MFSRMGRMWKISGKFLLISWFVISEAPVFAQPSIDFEEKTIKFVKTKAGEIINFEYIFTNTGDQPLIISEVKVTCGCTKPLFPTEPVKPGEKNKISVSFDTKGKTGYQDRILEVISNAKNSPEKLRFKGMVENEK